MVVNRVMTQVWCSLVYCILRWIFCIRFCTAKHLLSVCLLCSCGSSTLSLGVSLSMEVSFLSVPIDTEIRVWLQNTDHDSFKSTQVQSYLKYSLLLWWETAVKGSFFPATAGGNIPSPIMKCSLWALRHPGGCTLWLILPAGLQVNRGNWQEHSSVATECPAACSSCYYHHYQGIVGPLCKLILYVLEQVFPITS